MDDVRREVALFRYSLIREAADPSLTSRQRGEIVRELAAGEHRGPNGKWIKISRPSIDRYIRLYRSGGSDALSPVKRHRPPRTDMKLLELAVALKREAPRRTAAQVAEIITTAEGKGPSKRTIQRHFVTLGLNGRGDGSPKEAFSRFQAERPGDLWTGDALHGPVIAGRKTYLFAFIDDHSRAIVGYRWGLSEDTVRLEAALRSALSSRGIPGAVYVDNGSAFVSRQLVRTLATLGIRLVHSRPGRPEGRGKIERFFRTVRLQFLVEIEARPPVSVEEMNRLFSAWVESVYHRRVHSETGQAPIERLLQGPARRLPSPAELREAFLWSETRSVTKVATVLLHSNVYEVDPALVGCKVEVVFDPFDLTAVEIRFQARPMGKGIPVVAKRHSHPKAKPEVAPSAAPTGIDYLGLVAKRREEELAKAINYREMSLFGEEETGQAQGAGTEQSGVTA